MPKRIGSFGVPADRRGGDELYVGRSRERPTVCMFLKTGQEGKLLMIAEWTPAQAREFAQGIIDSADRVEGGHA